MREVAREGVPAPGASTLVWLGGELFDVSAGWQRLGGGSARRPRYNRFGPHFDAVERSPNADLVALVTSVGTKALLLEPDGPVFRELNRSHYHADAYRYPLTLCTLPDGQTGLVHCPNRYNQLEIELARTGHSNGHPPERQPPDVFHSRLAVSPSGRYLLSAGLAVAAVGLPHRLRLARRARRPLDPRRVRHLRPAGAHSGGGGWGRVRRRRRHYQHLTGAERRRGTIRPRPQHAGPLVDPAAPLPLEAPTRPLRRGPAADRRGRAVPRRPPPLARPGDRRRGVRGPDLPTGTAASSIVYDNAFSGRARVAIDERTRRLAHTDGTQVTIVTWDSG